MLYGDDSHINAMGVCRQNEWLDAYKKFLFSLKKETIIFFRGDSSYDSANIFNLSAKRIFFGGKNTPLSFPRIAERYIFLKTEMCISCVGEVACIFIKSIFVRGCDGFEVPKGNLVKGTFHLSFLHGIPSHTSYSCQYRHTFL